MSAPYGVRFAQALAGLLPKDFAIHEDHGIVSVHYGSASMVGFLPTVRDKRAPIAPGDPQRWLTGAEGRLRRGMYHYTPAAKEAGGAMLGALEAHRAPKAPEQVSVTKTPEQIAAEIMAARMGGARSPSIRNLIAEAIEADRAQWFDTSGSASSQHYIDTGRYLLHEEVTEMEEANR